METLLGSMCRACRLRVGNSAHRSTFSTISKLSAIPPESPHYVDVPQSHQADLYVPRRPKGILPEPREIFPKRRPDKPSEQYILNATPNRKKPVDASKLDNESRYKLQMGLIRKQHLREGLTELHQRKQDNIRSTTQRSMVKRAERARLMAQAERNDERLTKVSVPKAMQPKNLDELSNEEAMEMYETKKANYDRWTAAKHAQRQDALHTLYMNARTFITDEEQLKAKIVEEFDEKSFGGSPSTPHKSYWDESQPDTIKQMINRTFLGPRPSISLVEEEAFRKDQSRMKRIAEKLSGGKI